MKGYTLYDIVRYAQSLGVRSLVGEERALLTTFLAFVMGKKGLLIESFSGSGKTIIADAIMGLIKSEQKFEIRMTSPQYLYYNADVINNSSFVLFPELQKVAASPETMEILKDWGEGKHATRGVADVARFRETHGQVGSMELELDPKPFLTTVAIENSQYEVVQLREFLRRITKVHTDPGTEQNRRVIEQKLLQWAGRWKETANQEERQGLIDHIDRCINGPRVEEKRIRGYVNPAAGALIKSIPLDFIEVRSALPRLITITNGVARFYHANTLRSGDNLLVAPIHLWLAWRIYGQSFLQDALNIPEPMGEQILGLIPEANDPDFATIDECVSSNQLWEQLRGQGYALTRDQLQKLLERLVFNGWLAELEGTFEQTAHYYYRSSLREVDVEPNWAQVVETAQANILADHPDKADEYIKRFCPGRQKTVTDPLTGKEIAWLK